MMSLEGVRTNLHAGTYPLIVSPVDAREPLDAWARAHRDAIDAALLTTGAILFRGFPIDTADAFQRAAATLCNTLLDYEYRSTPRTAVGQKVYTATEYRADATIPQHNENAYQRDWPMRLVFGCLLPAASGGETPLARSADVTRRLDPALRGTFAERGVMYIRNYGHGVDLPWQTTFQTHSPAEVEAYCRRQGIEWEWLDQERLRTCQVCHALMAHPATGQQLWFNQVHLFHPSSLGPERHQAMLEVFGEGGLPRNACFGDGGRIDDDTLQQIRAAYDAELVTFPWGRRDVLLLDNMLVSHGRRPFTGPRQVLVAMGDPYSHAVSPRRGSKRRRVEAGARPSRDDRG